MGLRVEHPREVIDKAMYHKRDVTKALGAAEYRFTSQQNERGVYSFCMCPGGFVVPSATDKEQIVVNGMSAAGRNSQWSNAAFVVETRANDIPEDFINRAKDLGSTSLAGLLWRESIERETFLNGDGQKAPAQRLVDFLAQKESSSLPRTSYAPGVVSSRLDKWLPCHIKDRLSSAFIEAAKKIKGFDSPEALLIASETRTSTPVRIIRDAESGESVCLKNLYPAGEGAGYAGGIVSSALDGIKQSKKILQNIYGLR